MDLPGRNTVMHLDHTGPMTFSQDARSTLKNFIRWEPGVLGVSQIMIGLMNTYLWVMFKIYLISHHDLFLSPTEVTYLHFLISGPIFYVISGTLSVISGKKITKNMIHASLGMNTISTILAGVMIIIAAFGLNAFRGIFNVTLQNFLFGIIMVKLILTVLEFFIALSLSAFGCNVICCEETTVVVDLSSKELELFARAPYHDYDDVVFPPT